MSEIERPELALQPAQPNSAKWLLVALGASLLYLASLPLVLGAQMAVAGALIVALGLAKRFADRHDRVERIEDHVRIFVILCGTFVTLRYLCWRSLNTLHYHDPASLIAAITLYLAELYGIIIYLLGGFVNLMPLRRRSPPLPEDTQDWPSVDVFVPSYNEDEDLLEITLIAATQIRYPRAKLQVYLLDDGGTAQKRQDSDPSRSAAAWERHRALQRLCERVGARYLTRERNEHAKAGNINEALKHSRGELILILDADHVPTVDFLHKTVGFFLRDPKMFLVQTPHFFINPDPIEKNLETYSTMPSENEMFYSVIQHGLDFWNASFFCGSAAVLRRSHLQRVGGISGQTITEDAETALGLHGLGYKSAYLGRPMISGLQPETFSGFILQRVRWAQGMIQIFLLNNPWRSRRLTLWQKLAYTNSSFFWFFPFARTVFLLAPSAFLLFGMKIYDANLAQFFAYALPHLVGAILVAHYLYGKVRWTFISELYETMQSLFSLVAIAKVFVNPRAPQFNVTPKGEHLEEDFVSSLSNPFYILIVIGIVSLAAGVYRYVQFPLERDVVWITASWQVFNLIILTAALGALLERRQQRKSPRVPVATSYAARLRVGDLALDGVIENLSAYGAGVVLHGAGASDLCTGAVATLELDDPLLGRQATLHARIRRVLNETSGARPYVGLMFEPQTLEERRDIVALAFGNSALLLANLNRRQRQIGVGSSLGFLLRTGFVHGAQHVTFRIHQLLRLSWRVPSRIRVWLWEALDEEHAGRGPGGSAPIRFRRLGRGRAANATDRAAAPDRVGLGPG